MKNLELLEVLEVLEINELEVLQFLEINKRRIYRPLLRRPMPLHQRKISFLKMITFGFMLKEVT
jgi:hypothetical protein